MKLAALCVLCSMTSVATADEITLARVCVELDAGDGLVEADRARAELLLRQVLEREDQLVVASGCTDSFVLSHERAGDGFVIRLRSTAGKRRMTTRSLDELAVKYRRLARSLLVPLPEAGVTPTPAPYVEPDDPAPTMSPQPTELTTPAPHKSRLWYALFGAQPTGGSAGAFGYRRHLERVSLDAALAFRGGDDMDGAGGVSLGVEVFGRHRSSPNATFYGGGGLSLGASEAGDANGEGLQGELTAGLDLGGRHGIHGLVQFDVTLPFYALDTGRYLPSLTITGGVGW